jgi:hypothetical protein
MSKESTKEAWGGRVVSKWSGFPSIAVRRLGSLAVAVSMLISTGCEGDPPCL